MASNKIPAVLAERQRLYDEGLNDAEIARRQGVCRYSVRQWRHRKGLPAYIPARVAATPAELAKIREMNEAGYSDTAISRILGRSDAWGHVWRVRMGLKRNFEPPYQRGAARVMRPASKTIRAVSCAQQSLDAPTRFGMPFGHIIKDDSMSAWLEEMGATVW